MIQIRTETLDNDLTLNITINCIYSKLIIKIGIVLLEITDQFK
jgi:hypothetical protein